jgi:chromate transport protein ChrA
MLLDQEVFQRDPSLVALFLSFLKLGFTSFGGPAMIAYIRRLAVEQKGWPDDSTFKDGVALCQSRIFEGIQEKVSKALMPRDA